MKLCSTKFNSLCLWGTWFTLFWRWWLGCLCSLSDDCYHQPSDYPKQSPSIIPLMLLWSFIAFSFLPPVCIATCHTAYSSAGWCPGGILFAFQRRWARESLPLKLQNDTHRFDGSVTRAPTLGRWFQNMWKPPQTAIWSSSPPLPDPWGGQAGWGGQPLGEGSKDSGKKIFRPKLAHGKISFIASACGDHRWCPWSSKASLASWMHQRDYPGRRGRYCPHSLYPSPTIDGAFSLQKLE